MPRCDDVNIQDNEWFIADDPEFNRNDDKIAQFMLLDFNNTPSLDRIEEPEQKLSYDTAYLVL